MVIADVEFFVTTDLAEIHGHMSSTRHFLLGKNRPMIEAIVALREQNEIRRIVDLGIFKGGSVALYAKLFEPEKLVAIEYTASPVKPLAELIAADGLTDQSDRPKMKSILDEEFPDRNIDLVIDDASHFYQETRSSFNLIFPYLKPGGIYIVEDCGCAHWPGATWQKSQAIPAWKPPLSNLLFEICVLSASRSDLVAEVKVSSMSFMVPGGACTHWKAPPYHGAPPLQSLVLALSRGQHARGAGMSTQSDRPRHAQENGARAEPSHVPSCPIAPTRDKLTRWWR